MPFNVTKGLKPPIFHWEDRELMIVEIQSLKTVLSPCRSTAWHARTKSLTGIQRKK